ncbi:hypothetical protein F5Y15DRAFT_33624 [Xylariaceae sp. FL0016]|nr:hypothetical protein F5Y15DRAFT_33624 [Xylariaceae sp. FL0016]
MKSFFAKTSYIPSDELEIESNQDDFTIFNDSICPRPDTSRTFTFFSRLPGEIRLMIWRKYVQEPRILKIGFRSPFIHGSEPLDGYYEQRNSLGNIISGIDRVIVCRGLRVCPLLSVNREARDISISHYRVRVPCRIFTAWSPWYGDRIFKAGPPPLGNPKSPWSRGRMAQATVAINPEWDVLWLDNCNFHFLHDLRAYDPLGIGLKSLAVTPGMVKWDERDLQAAKAIRATAYSHRHRHSTTDHHALFNVPPQPGLDCVKGLLTGLSSVYFVITYHSFLQNQMARKFLEDLRTDFNNLEMARWCELGLLSACNNPRVVNVGPDPRPLDEDESVVGHWDSFRERDHWRGLEAALGVPPRPLDYQFLFTSEQDNFHNRGAPFFINNRISCGEFMLSLVADWSKTLSKETMMDNWSQKQQKRPEHARACSPSKRDDHARPVDHDLGVLVGGCRLSHGRSDEEWRGPFTDRKEA